MPKFSKTSEERLRTCHPDIVAVCRELIKQYDFSVLCGRRNKEEQELAFMNGNSKLQYPKSKHNAIPSVAIDIAPYPINWDDLSRFQEMWIRFDTLAKYFKECGKITSDFEWGGNWKTLKDYPHIEIKK